MMAGDKVGTRLEDVEFQFGCRAGTAEPPCVEPGGVHFAEVAEVGASQEQLGRAAGGERRGRGGAHRQVTLGVEQAEQRLDYSL